MDNLQAAKRLIGLANDVLPVALPLDGSPDTVVSLAGLARVQALLSGQQALYRQGEFDAMGALLRPLFEVWLVAMHALLGEPDVIGRLIDDQKVEMTKLTARLERRMQEDAASGREWRLGAPQRLKEQIQEFEALVDRTPPEKAATLDSASRAQHVQALLEELGDENADFPVRAYDFVYGGESYLSVHGSLGAIEGYFQTADGCVVISPTRDTGDRGDHMLGLAAAMLGTLLLGLVRSAEPVSNAISEKSVTAAMRLLHE